MAVLTFTATDATSPPRLSHEGLTVARAVYTHGGATSLSASDLVYMVRVPNNIRIVDGYITGTTGGDATVWKVGVGGTDDNLLTGGTLSATAQMKRFNGLSMPIKISLSDDAVPLSSWVFLTRTSGTSTATASISLVITYGPSSVV